MNILNMMILIFTIAQISKLKNRTLMNGVIKSYAMTGWK